MTALIDALAPPLCVLCRDPPGSLPWLCARCARDLTLLRGELCLRCGAPRPLVAPLCGACPDWPGALRAVRSAAPHEGAARALVHALKYAGSLAAARPLGTLVAAAARRLPLCGDELVVPVPLHWQRRRKRGFNQARELAAVLAPELGLRLRPQLLRRVKADSGSVHRTPRGRMRAVRGAFRASRAVRGQRVLLIDDVLTTGATIGSCARALARRGVADVWAATATRAL